MLVVVSKLLYSFDDNKCFILEPTKCLRCVKSNNTSLYMFSQYPCILLCNYFVRIFIISFDSYIRTRQTCCLWSNKKWKIGRRSGGVAQLPSSYIAPFYTWLDLVVSELWSNNCLWYSIVQISHCQILIRTQCNKSFVSLFKSHCAVVSTA